METPSSTRRLTRSQAMAAAAANTTTVVSKKLEESEKKAAAKSRNGNEQERSALFDITNDSPIVGVAMGSLETPSSSAMSKKRAIMNAVSKQLKTPGSGEALLRGQVKTLLQKVEEEAEVSKLSAEYRPFLHLKGVVNNSPTGLLAPTPANTPHLSLSGNNGLPSSPVEEEFLIPQMVDGICDWKKEEMEMEMESEKSMVTRTLFLDFSEKLESENKEKTRAGVDDDDDDSSVWSIQVNASSIRDEDEEEEEEEGEEECDEYYEEEEEEEVCDGGLMDELCEGISKMSVKFSGKHTRFVYNSDGELEGVVVEEKAASLCI
ncbi:acidic leucine-rich nuclear phosphoprotein 32 family member C-like [Ipomoea triloba]|uniref:acidic leucine-rich nuclear phosphoprotein 32 family member C-like n=1 Tax=Ipomoea triloba TaxID=35885 RepID=UPI00125D5A0E|nr:acidic leucine-rich nuclear phosphoprotein 32 family member C-like [Ipomoea triloba]